MSDKKDLKFKNIGKFRYRELFYFCMQYPQWKRELQESILISSVQITGLPNANVIADNTQKSAIKRIKLENKCKLIEQAAIEADSELYLWIIRHVTEQISYEYLRPPCGRRKFYKLRQTFFNILDKYY